MNLPNQLNIFFANEVCGFLFVKKRILCLCTLYCDVFNWFGDCWSYAFFGTASAVHFYFERIIEMACFLVDYENESGRLLQGISLAGLTKEDELIIFYSKHARRVKFHILKELDNTPAKKEYIMVETDRQRQPNPNRQNQAFKRYLPFSLLFCVGKAAISKHQISS